MPPVTAGDPLIEVFSEMHSLDCADTSRRATISVHVLTNLLFPKSSDRRHAIHRPVLVYLFQLKL